MLGALIHQERTETLFNFNSIVCSKHRWDLYLQWKQIMNLSVIDITRNPRFKPRRFQSHCFEWIYLQQENPLKYQKLVDKIYFKIENVRHFSNIHNRSGDWLSYYYLNEIWNRNSNDARNSTRLIKLKWLLVQPLW